MDVQIQQIAPIHVVMMRHTGPYEQMDAVFNQLWGWVSSHQVPVQRTIGIYWDNPDYVQSYALRAAACYEVPAGFQMPDTGGLQITLEDLAGGNYAITRYVGPYEDMAPVWSKFTKYIEKNLRRTISQNPAFEVYVNDPDDTPANQLITDLYMPVL